MSLIICCSFYLFFLLFRVTCVYLATKVEEFNVSISQFVANVKGDREKATEIILNHELLLMQQLNFDLAVYNPYRPVEGFLIDIKVRLQYICLLIDFKKQVCWIFFSLLII